MMERLSKHQSPTHKGRKHYQQTIANTHMHKDYREHKELYKYVGFFVIIAAVFLFAFKVTSWVVWAHQCISASI